MFSNLSIKATIKHYKITIMRSLLFYIVCILKKKTISYSVTTSLTDIIKIDLK